jgi:hypothetical protein
MATERPQEGAARKMEIDEDYNDAGEDDKRNVNKAAPATSPRSGGGIMNGASAKTEP